MNSCAYVGPIAGQRNLLLEFLGLPGAGKTTLENALIPLLEHQGLPVIRRSELIRKTTSGAGLIDANSYLPMRKLHTAIYKTKLTLKALGRNDRSFTMRHLPHPHLRRTAIRVEEDTNVIQELAGDAARARQVYLLGEGYFQHTIAYTVWCGLLANKQSSRTNSNVSNSSVYEAVISPRLEQQSCKHVVIAIVESKQRAQERLLTRGVPNFWPRTVALDDIMNGFSLGIDRLRQSPPTSTPNIIEVESPTQLEGWQTIVERLAHEIPLYCN